MRKWQSMESKNSLEIMWQIPKRNKLYYMIDLMLGSGYWMILHSVLISLLSIILKEFLSFYLRKIK
jgi:hypothetical protein